MRTCCVAAGDGVDDAVDGVLLGVDDATCDVLFEVDDPPVKLHPASIHTLSTRSMINGDFDTLVNLIFFSLNIINRVSVREPLPLARHDYSSYFKHILLLRISLVDESLMRMEHI